MDQPRPIKFHNVKCWPEYFQALLEGRKTFDIRLDDGRNYEERDLLIQEEWNPETKRYTGHRLWMEILYLVKSEDLCFGQAIFPPGYKIMSVRLTEPQCDVY